MRRDISSRTFMKFLDQLGFVLVRQRAAHAILKHPEKGLVITVPVGNRNVSLSIVQAILRQLDNFNIGSRDELVNKLERLHGVR